MWTPVLKQKGATQKTQAGSYVALTPPCGEKKIITQDVRSRAYYPLNVVILTISILYNISAPRMSDSVESNVLLRSTSFLERAFESDSDLAHHLNKEGYLKDDDYDDVINPKTMLSGRKRLISE